MRSNNHHYNMIEQRLNIFTEQKFPLLREKAHLQVFIINRADCGDCESWLWDYQKNVGGVCFLVNIQSFLSVVWVSSLLFPYYLYSLLKSLMIKKTPKKLVKNHPKYRWSSLVVANNYLDIGTTSVIFGIANIHIFFGAERAVVNK